MDFNWLIETPIAHRGLHSDSIPENSIPAFEEAIRFGCNIEIDVRLTKDKHLVVFHDNSLKRMCGLNAKVSSLTLDEIKQQRLLSTEYTIPTFDEFLELVNGRTGILCEIKKFNPYNNAISAAACKRVENYDGNIAFQSFNYGAVRYCRKHSKRPVGQLLTWVGPTGKDQSCILNWMGKLSINKISKPHFTAYDIRSALDNKYLEKTRNEMPVLVWTINSEERFNTALKVADNIIFEKIGDLVKTAYADKLHPTILPN